ncbi:hypothetical protein KEM52_005772 [Ascosphaera acerosa]|nr:hypothetical protein KEM52_005772 [Ascosphaera acerosa]
MQSTGPNPTSWQPSSFALACSRHEALRRHYRPAFSYPALACITSLLLAQILFAPATSAGFVPFDDCLPQTIVNSEPRRLQFTPRFVWSSIGDAPDRLLNITVYGNVSGISVDPKDGDTLPPPGDPAWSDEKQTRGKIVGVDGNYTTMFTRWKMMEYTLNTARPVPFCDALVHGSCPIAPVFDANE